MRQTLGERSAEMSAFDFFFVFAAGAYVFAVAVDMVMGGVLTDALFDFIFKPKPKGKP
jgi:hypothetical protein